jgi:hypothetical protein
MAKHKQTSRGRRTGYVLTQTIVIHDEYHINYKRGEGFNAMIDSPFFSAISLGWFETQTAAQVAVDQYRYEELTQVAA